MSKLSEEDLRGNIQLDTTGNMGKIIKIFLDLKKEEKMNIKNLAKKVAGKESIAINLVEKVIEKVLNEITLALVNKEKVRLVGFGNFVVKNRKSRVGRNPKTGEKMEIASVPSVRFIVGSKLKKKVRSVKEMKSEGAGVETLEKVDFAGPCPFEKGVEK